MDRLTRKELKSDKFALEVQHSVEYVSEHRRQLTRWGGAALAVVAVIVAVYFYRQYQHSVREAALTAALQIKNAPVVPQAPNEFMKTFPTQAERDKAMVKAFTELASKYPGTDEGVIAEYYLATTAADQGNLAEAEKRFKLVIDSGNSAYVSLAKLALASVYASEGKTSEGEKLIQTVIDHPTIVVSKEQATIALAQLVAPDDPSRARKLLEPLRSSQRSNVSRAALTALADLPQK